MGNACPATQASCGGACVNTASDSKNCGACGNACNGAQMCSAGTCVCADPGAPDVCGTGLSSYCTNTQNSVKNCGKCGSSCKENHLCSGGICRPTCTTNAQCDPKVNPRFVPNMVCPDQVRSPQFIKNMCSAVYCNSDVECQARGTGYCMLGYQDFKNDGEREEVASQKYTCTKKYCNPNDGTIQNCTAKQACVFGDYNIFWNKTLFPEETLYTCSDTFCGKDSDCTKRCAQGDNACLAKRCAIQPNVQNPSETNTCVSNYCLDSSECKEGKKCYDRRCI